MLSVSNLSKMFGNKSVLKTVSFSIKDGQRVGLVGPNGCGKTTLCRILASLDPPDTGSIQFAPRNLTIGYLHQGFTISDQDTVGEYITARQGNADKLERKLIEISTSLSVNPDSIELQSEYDRILLHLSALTQQPDHGAEILIQLGLDRFTPDTPIAYLSGGQKTRLALAGILLQRPQFLLLDEPTNHLDIEMLEWLENFLSRSPCTMLIISHDRALLDNLATRILELDPVSHTTKEYTGNYSDYISQKQAERSRHWQEFTDQQDEIGRLSATTAHIRGIARFRKGGKADTGDKFAKGFFANRGLETIRRAKSIEKRIDQLNNEDRVEKPRQTWQMKIEFERVSSAARDVLVVENLSIGYDGKVLLPELNFTLKTNQRVALLGPNGSGKSTLIKTIVGDLPPISGQFRLGSGIRVGYMAQEHKNHPLDATALTVLSHALTGSETEVRSFLSKFLFKGDDVFTHVADMSYGERVRLSLAALVADGCNLLLLDEPINHLDIPARVRFEEALAAYEGTVIAVVHDRYFIQNFATRIWEIKNGALQIIA